MISDEGVYRERAGSESKSKDDSEIWTINHKETIESTKKCHTYEEAIVLAGNGRYNASLLVVLGVVLVAMALDMFGFSVVVAGSNCDLHLTLTEKGILTSMPFAGAIIMSYPWGYYSDTQGRRKSLIIAMGVSFVMSVACSLSPNWKVMAVFRLIGTSFSSAAQSATYSLLGECCMARVRGGYMLLMTSAIMLTPTIYFSIGYAVLNLKFSYYLNVLGIWYSPWRLLTLIYGLPLGITALMLTFFYESPKFLASQGKTEEAVEVLKKIYVRNGGVKTDYQVKDLNLEEQGNIKKTEQTFLQSIWNQTAPLFKPPLLVRTLQLYFITIVLYGTNNSFIIWFPFLSDALFSSYGSSVSGDTGLCDLITSTMANTTSVQDINVTQIIETCSSSLETRTVISGICHSLSFTILNSITSKFAARRKIIMLLSLILAIVGGVGSNLAPEPVSTMVFFIMFMITALGMGVMSAYFVELYPTSHRGMAACLGVMVARLSSLAGINFVASVIVDYCTTIFYSWSVFLLSGVAVAWFLPPDKIPKKL